MKTYEELLAENDELKLQVNSLKYEISKAKDELYELKCDNKMLNRLIADLKLKDEPSEVPFYE